MTSIRYISKRDRQDQNQRWKEQHDRMAVVGTIIYQYQQHERAFHKTRPGVGMARTVITARVNGKPHGVVAEQRLMGS